MQSQIRSCQIRNRELRTAWSRIKASPPLQRRGSGTFTLPVRFIWRVSEYIYIAHSNSYFSYWSQIWFLQWRHHNIMRKQPIKWLVRKTNRAAHLSPSMQHNHKSTWHFFKRKKFKGITNWVQRNICCTYGVILFGSGAFWKSLQLFVRYTVVNVHQHLNYIIRHDYYYLMHNCNSFLDVDA